AARRELHRSHHVVLRVGDVELSVGEREALGLVEVRLLGGSISEAGLATSDDPSHVPIEARLDDAVVTGVGHEETAAGLLGQVLSREQRRRERRRLLTGEPERSATENTASLELGDHLADEPIEGLELELALVLADHLAARIDEHQRGPGAHSVRLPDTEVA